MDNEFDADTRTGTDATVDSVTENSSQSWFSRIGGALVGVLIGLVLIPGSIALIAWNESRAVATATALTEGSGSVIDVGAGAVDPANQGRLVHVAGPLVVPGTLADPAYGVSAPGAVKLIRHVEMYQWLQTENRTTRNKVGGGTETETTYTYRQEWSDTAHDSSKFKAPSGHVNPAFRVAQQTSVAPLGTIGAFRLDAALLGMLDGPQPLAVQTAAGGGRLSDGGLYLGANPQTPVVGDVKVTYSVVRPAAASVVARQDGAALGPYTARNGRTLLMIDPGEVSAAAMFKQAQADNVVLTWIGRGAGAVLMMIGFYLLLRPLEVFASVLPFLGSLVGTGAFLLALLATLVTVPVVVAIAWLAARPLLGGGLLAGAAVAAVVAVAVVRQRRATPALQPA